MNYEGFESDIQMLDNRLIVPTLEEAYTSLMTNRNDNLYISSDEGGLTEEDVLCNTNLRTAGLFKGYTEELKLLQNEYNGISNDEENISKMNKDIRSSLGSIRSHTQKYHAASTDSLDGNIMILNRSLESVILSMMNEIQVKKSTLDVKIQKITKKLGALRSLIQTGLDDMADKDTTNKKLCAICFDREIDVVMVPCGHTSCNGCSNYNKLSKCMHCRSIIHQRVKIYFS